MDTKKIGRFIALKRKEQKMTQIQLAEHLGVTGKTISRWENGNYMPDLSMLNPLCEVLHITLEELLAGESAVKNVPPEAEAKESLERYEKKMRAEKRRLLETVLTLAALGLAAAVLLVWAFWGEPTVIAGENGKEIGKYLFWIIVASGGAAVIAFGFAIYHPYHQRQLGMLDEMTTGTVTGLVRSHMFRNDVYGDVPGGVLIGWGVAQGEQYWGGMLKMRIPPWFPCVKYEVDGKVYQKLAGEGVWKDTWDIGQEVTVLYKPGAPGICCVEGDPSYREKGKLCAVLGAVCAVICIAAIAVLVNIW